MKLVKEEAITGGITLMPGDSIQVTCDDEFGEKVVLVTHTTEKMQELDVARVYEIEPGELGLEGGFAGVVGKKQKETV